MAVTGSVWSPSSWRSFPALHQPEWPSEERAEAVRAKPDASLVRAVRAVAEGNADAVVSAGNTGAMLAASLLELRRLPGVMRPAIAVPGEHHGTDRQCRPLAERHRDSLGDSGNPV